jgi:UDP-N-acetylmuramate--alanine ligase
LNETQLKAKVYTYAVNTEADFYAYNVRVGEGKINFDFQTPTHSISNIELGVPVWVNIENGVAAMAVASLIGATDDELREGMRSFSGVYRRFNIYVNTPNVAYIDDYAHHPMELKACIQSVRTLYPDRHVIGVFQPHLFSRTQDFADDFAAVLSELDEVALLPIYPAREKPINGVTSEWLMDKITTKRALVLPTILAKFLRERTKKMLAADKKCVVVTMGAGDIDRQVNDIAKALQL